jgi:uncharacterized membrane protein
VPIFGFGGSGLLAFLVLMAVVGLMLSSLRGGGATASLPGRDGQDSLASSGVSVAEVQVGLLASAKVLQTDLRRMAETADTTTSSGLQRVLQETTLSLLRNPELWVYANSEVGQIPFTSAEATFNRLSMQERSKLERELTANVSGRRHNETSTGVAGQSDATSDFIAVTLLVASRSKLDLKGTGTAEDLRESLQRLGSVRSEDLLALEVIWQPEGRGEVLSQEDLLTAYPQMQHL